MIPKNPWDLINWKKDTTLSSRAFVRLFGGKTASLIHKGKKRRK